MKSFFAFSLFILSITAFATDALIQGWTVVTGGPKGGVEYSLYSPEPVGIYSSRGEGTFKLAVTLEEEIALGERLRFIRLDWYRIIRPQGVDASWPYRKHPLRNIPVEELTFESIPFESTLSKVIYDVGRTDGYSRYNAQIRVAGKIWSLKVHGFNNDRLTVDIDSNDGLNGAYWSERTADLRDVVMPDLETLIDAPHALSYNWIEENDLSHYEKAIIEKIAKYYRPGTSYNDFIDYNKELEQYIQWPEKWPYIAQRENQFFLDNLQQLGSYFTDSVLPGIYDLFSNPHDIDHFELVQNSMGNVIAVIVELTYHIEGWDDGGCYFGVLKTINPAAQKRSDYIRLGRGDCF